MHENHVRNRQAMVSHFSAAIHTYAEFEGDHREPHDIAASLSDAQWEMVRKIANSRFEGTMRFPSPETRVAIIAALRAEAEIKARRPADPFAGLTAADNRSVHFR